MFASGKKKEEIIIADVVYMHTAAKWHACLEAYKKDTTTVFIAWFEETQQQVQGFFEQQNVIAADVILYRQAVMHYVKTRQLIFVEHFPLREKEDTLYSSLNFKEAKILSSLEDPLFEYFGGSRIIEVMKKMGLQENEAIQHPMVTMALKNAQKKLAKKILIEQPARSQAEWFKRNVGSEK